MKIIHTYPAGTQETLRLTKSQRDLGERLAKKFNVVNPDQKHTWRGFVRAVLSGDIPIALPAPDKRAEEACNANQPSHE